MLVREMRIKLTVSQRQMATPPPSLLQQRAVNYTNMSLTSSLVTHARILTRNLLAATIVRVNVDLCLVGLLPEWLALLRLFCFFFVYEGMIDCW